MITLCGFGIPMRRGLWSFDGFEVRADDVGDAADLRVAPEVFGGSLPFGVAMNSAQVRLVKGDLRGIAQARIISQETVANMKQNLDFAFVYNARASRWPRVCCIRSPAGCCRR